MGLKKIGRYKRDEKEASKSIDRSQMLRVLYVEDNHANWEITEISLRESYNLERAKNSDQALELLNNRRFDLVLMDIELQGSRLDGIQITQKVRKEGRDKGLSFGNIPIIFVTAYSARYTRSDLLSAGGDDLVEKPVDFPKLQRSMASLFRAKSESAETERHKREEVEVALSHERVALSQANESLAFVESKLIQADKMVVYGTLTASIIHEICSPINAIVGSIGPLSDVLASFKESAEESSAENKDLVEQLETLHQILDISSKNLHEQVNVLRRGSRAAKEFVEDVNLELVVQEATLVAGTRIKRIALRVEQTESMPSVRCIPGQIGQILLNLIINAADALEALEGHHDPGIVIRLSEKQVNDLSYARIEVHDQGRGVPEDIRSSIFDGFFTTKEADRGTGLGLSVCKKIAASHHGELTVADSQILGGACFVLTLPVGGPSDTSSSSS